MKIGPKSQDQRTKGLKTVDQKHGPKDQRQSGPKTRTKNRQDQRPKTDWTKDQDLMYGISKNRS